MATTLDTHELAWAAGFFDGEGSTNIPRDLRRSEGGQIRLMVVQADIRPLQRFHAAVGGLGTLSARPTPLGNHKPQWAWYAQKFEVVQATLAMLWGFLGEPKREQATRCLREYAVQRHSYGPLPQQSLLCSNGHPWDEANTYVFRPGGVTRGRRCRACNREYRQRKRGGV